MHADALSFISKTQVPMAPVQSISTLCAISPSPIVVILITSPTPMDLIYCSFTPEKVLTSLQLSVSKIKVTYQQMKTQFSGSGDTKSRQFPHAKDRFIGTGWKMKKKQGLCQFASKVPKSVRSMKSPSQKKKRASRKLCKKSGRILIQKKSSS